MNLYIMTRGRVGTQLTLKTIPEKWKDRTYLVVPEEEKDKHDHQTLAVPPEVDNYSKKFQWILHNGMDDGFKKAVIMDDDLIFSRAFVRLGAQKKSLITIKDPELMSPLWEYMEELLENTALVGVHPRQMGNYVRDPNYVVNGKIICIQGVNREMIGKVKVDYYPILADVVLNCTLLSRGQGNKLITRFFQDHASCQAPGGCSIYRTPEMQAEACRFIADRFPHATLVTKKPKASKWMGEERVDLRVQWKKMYESGKQKSSEVLD